MKGNKQRKLFELLIKQQGIVAVERYAEILRVSKRSVYSYLSEIEPSLNKRGFELKKIPSKGIEIISNECLIKDKEEELDEFSLDSRRYELINRILIHDEIIDLNQFCEEFYISESSVRNDVATIQKIVQSFNDVDIVISKRKIYKTKCDEVDLINAIIYINEILSQGLSRSEKEEYYNIVFDTKVVEIVKSVVNHYINALNLNVANYYIYHINSVIITLTSRVLLGNHIVLEDNSLDYDKFKKMADVLLAQQFLTNIANQLNIGFSDGDVDFVSNYLKADRIQISKVENISLEDLIIYRKIISKFERFINITFDEEDELVQNLFAHLNAMVFRLRNHIMIRNNLLDNVKREFGALFNLIWIVLESESEHLQIQCSDDEIGFLLIHVQNIIEKQKKTKNVLIVCPQGVVTSNLIANKIREIIPTYNFVEVISFERINKVKLDSIDFVISTVDIPNIRKPLLIVSPIITTDDIRNIINFYHEKIVEHQHRHRCSSLLKYIDDKFIFELNLESRDEIIDKVCDELVEKGIVTSKYKESVKYRETLSLTDNAFMFAIPHGDVKYVNETKMGIVLLKNHIRWNKHNVSIIIFFNIKKDDLVYGKAILDDIYGLMHSKVFNLELRNGIDKERFVKFIESESYD